MEKTKTKIKQKTEKKKSSFIKKKIFRQGYSKQKKINPSISFFVTKCKSLFNKKVWLTGYDLLNKLIS